MSSRVLPAALAMSARPLIWRDTPAPISCIPEPASRPPGTAPAAVQTALPAPDIEAIAREAYAQGFQDGEKSSRELATAQMEPIMERLSRTLTSLVELRPRMRRDAEADLVQLSIAIARRVLHRELTIDPTSVQGLLKAALEKLQSREISRIRMNPDQEIVVRSCLERLMPSRRIELASDAALRPWEILFETESGWVDASIETQLNEIERGFADRLLR